MQSLVVLSALSCVSASTAQGECDDTSSLLQAKISQSRGTVNTASTGDALLQTVETVAKSFTGSGLGTMSPEDARTAIEAANAAVSSILPPLNDEHDAAERLVTRQFDEISDCHAINTVESLTQHLQGLESCNQELALLQATQTSDCNAWADHAHQVSSNIAGCGPHDTPELLLATLSYWRDWVETQGSAIDSYSTACTDATTAVNNKIPQCQALETAYETAFCQFSLSCSLLNECHSHEVAIYNGVISDVTVGMNARQAQYRTVRQVECLLQLIGTALDSSTTIGETEIATCTNNQNEDSGTYAHGFVIDFPSPPSLPNCAAPANRASIHPDPSCPELPEAALDWEDGVAQRETGALTTGGGCYGDEIANTDPDATAIVRCCTMDGTQCMSGSNPTADHDTVSCSAAEGLTFAAAQAFCASHDRRICTASEARRCCGTGCGHNDNLMWITIPS